MSNLSNITVVDRLGVGDGYVRQIRWCLLKRDYNARRFIFRSCRRAA